MTDAVKSFVGTYTLSKFNGKDPEQGEAKIPSLKLEMDGDKLKVHAKVANAMNGDLKYENGKLSGMLMSTRMMGPPFLMDVERALAAGFQAGMSVSREGDALILCHDKDTLHFVVDRSA
ncbi:hypothetical protein DQ04_02931020 [Trypanosoma grayi]|uniref:hypothetical protein n=1 Tax=Trypanosoma grayi TaxID=71804 RepID=UPI0004F46A88|nr:hypothetical protein DQ04_02931020 [Trypanosoma grayi]KEG11147.1 hypothetical protein DQ04_02931020 [Trypanosoma grayi]